MYDCICVIIHNPSPVRSINICQTSTSNQVIYNSSISPLQNYGQDKVVNYSSGDFCAKYLRFYLVIVSPLQDRSSFNKPPQGRGRTRIIASHFFCQDSQSCFRVMMPSDHRQSSCRIWPYNSNVIYYWLGKNEGER